MNENTNEGCLPDKLTFHYLKTDSYRTYHVDGAYGGLTPGGKIYMELFIERMPTPKQVTHVLQKDGTLGSEIGREGKEGMVREIEAGLVMDAQTATRLCEWLKDKVDQLNYQIGLK